MLILDVWREACRHAQVGDAVDHIAAILQPELPPATLILRRLDPDQLRLETVAVGGPGASDIPIGATAELPSGRLADLQAWARQGRVLRSRSDGVPAPADVAVPSEVTGDVIVGPLVDQAGEIIGAMVLAARVIGAVHEGAAERLLEPLSVLMTNDVRLQKLVRERDALAAESRALRIRLGQAEPEERLIGLRAVLERVAEVAATDLPVLLLGELGSGKETVAREIHRTSARAAGPMVRVNCRSVALGEGPAEILGREGGAPGWFERAEGGTLYLEEIGELPADAQHTLLAVLQDGAFRRLGGERKQWADARLVVASRRDPLTLVQEGRFREDLWYRLAGFPIRVPPLRERLGDLPALASHFARAAGLRTGGAPLAPSGSDLAVLSAYAWPGNLRELAVVIERAALLGGGRRLELNSALGARPPALMVGAGAEPMPAPSQVIPLAAATVQHIEAALTASDGRVEGPRGAAALLGVNPHTLRSRMRRLGVDWGRFRGRGG
jgi:hydrogenase-4 transcriptional activator